ncbi:MAG TPA: hypothetical protein VFK11_01440 [Candidatus Saccharimonadales bacterium]|nr:hypothetical protein [Candidatus Saccharimonadales bacterium]
MKVKKLRKRIKKISKKDLSAKEIFTVCLVAVVLAGAFAGYRLLELKNTSTLNVNYSISDINQSEGPSIKATAERNRNLTIKVDVGEVAGGTDVNFGDSGVKFNKLHNTIYFNIYADELKQDATTQKKRPLFNIRTYKKFAPGIYKVKATIIKRIYETGEVLGKQKLSTQVFVHSDKNRVPSGELFDLIPYKEDKITDKSKQPKGIKAIVEPDNIRLSFALGLGKGDCVSSMKVDSDGIKLHKFNDITMNINVGYCDVFRSIAYNNRDVIRIKRLPKGNYDVWAVINYSAGPIDKISKQEVQHTEFSVK